MKEIIETKEKTKFQRILSNIETILVVCLFISCLIICGTSICNKVDHISPLFLGYSYMHIETGSMAQDTITIDGKTYESGHNAGEMIILHTVDTKTLDVGDMICFYVNPEISATFDINSSKLISEENELKFDYSIGHFFGFHNKETSQSGKIGCSKVFHHIVKVYEDSDGVRWFKTRGSSNNKEDDWYVKETLVIGAYEKTKTGSFVASLTDFIKSIWGLVLIIVIILIIAASIYIKLIEKIKKDYNKDNKDVVNNTEKDFN